VNRLTKQYAAKGKQIMTLDDTGCLCTTMYRISPQHLAWALENLVEGRVVNRIRVEEDVKHWAKVALDRMLDIGVPAPKARPAEVPVPEVGLRSA
jgi:quinolinate synthase